MMTDLFQFNSEACNACKSFAESTNSMFEQWCSSCNGNGDVTSVQENNPEPVTPANVVFGNDAD
jgi:DnaJ-class molecular chaperone